MITDREVALEQALVAIIGAAIASGLDVKTLMDDAAAGLLGNVLPTAGLVTLMCRTPFKL